MKPILVNVRGCNGSGKTTVLRSFVRPDAVVTKIEVPHIKPVAITTVLDEKLGKIILVGDYLNSAGCFGLDRIKIHHIHHAVAYAAWGGRGATQAAIKYTIDKAIGYPNAGLVLFEGVLVSTIFEPWLQWSRQQGGMTWAFMDTPLDECLKRIYARNGGKSINEKQIGDKYRGILRIQEKAKAAGETVITIHDGEDLRTYLKTVIQ